MFSGDDLAGRLSHRSERSHRTLPVACIYNPPMDHHTLAAVSITGSGLDVLGSMYLAYDLLGGQSWTPALSNSRGHLLRRFRDWLRSRTWPVFRPGDRNHNRRHLGHRIQPCLSRATALSSSLGSAVQCNSRGRVWGWAVSHGRSPFCPGVCPSRHRRASLRLFSRHASCPRLPGQCATLVSAASSSGAPWFEPSATWRRH